MNIKSLRVFINVMEEGTLAQAAAKMNLSQSAASRLIQILEEEYSVTLFHRDKKRLLPTSEGESFYPEALRILSSIDEIPTVFRQLKSERLRPLRIICHPRLVNGLVVPAMISLAKREPKVGMKLEVHPRRHLGRRILHDLYDVGISALPLPVEGIQPQHLANLDVCVVVSKDHKLASRTSVTAEDLVGEAYIALDETTLLRKVVDDELRRSGQVLPITHEVSSSSAAIRMTIAGLGFTLTDRIGFDPKMADLLAVLPWTPNIQEKLGYFVSSGPTPHPMRDAFVECLQEVCAKL
jgi:DNA-binding transcriptional LysR family regulator